MSAICVHLASTSPTQGGRQHANCALRYVELIMHTAVRQLTEWQQVEQLQTTDNQSVLCAPRGNRQTVILAKVVARRALKAHMDCNLTTWVDTANPVRKAVIRIRQARRNAFHAVLGLLNQALVTRLVSCVHLARMILKLDNLVILASHAIRVISQTLKATPAAQAVIRDRIKTKLASLTAPPVSLGLT